LTWAAFGVSRASATDSDALIKLLIKKGLITERELAEVEAELATANSSAEAPTTIEDRVAKLEKDLGDTSAIRVGQGTLKVGGLFQGWAFWDGDDNDRFRIRRTELRFAGDILGDERFTYTIMVDPAQVTEDGTRKSVLQDAYFTLDHIPYLPHHTIQLGQYKLPSEEEGNRSSAKLDFAERSFIGRTIGEKRDIGAMLRGSWPYADYAVGVFNGDGQNTSDTNDQKDLAAKLVLKPLAGLKDWGSLELDVFGYHRPNPASVSEKKRLGWGARYEWERLSMKSAYALFQDAAAIGHGWYGQCGYFILPKKLQAVARIEGFDPNEGIANNAERDLTLGLNYFLAKHNVKTQLNWVRKDERGDEIDNDQVIGVFQYAF
jgi:phosphate-selective porin